MKVILISGTPGTGKTYLAKKLAKLKNSRVLDVNKIIKEKKLHDGYDRKRRCYIVDENRLTRYLEQRIKASKQDLIIDSHISHFLPSKLVDICIITKADLKTLKRRLEKRKYTSNKIRENLDSEIFDVCLNEALELGHNVMVYDSTANHFETFLKNFARNLGIKICPKCHKKH